MREESKKVTNAASMMCITNLGRTAFRLMHGCNLYLSADTGFKNVPCMQGLWTCFLGQYPTMSQRKSFLESAGIFQNWNICKEHGPELHATERQGFMGSLTYRGQAACLYRWPCLLLPFAGVPKQATDVSSPTIATDIQSLQKPAL